MHAQNDKFSVQNRLLIVHFNKLQLKAKQLGYNVDCFTVW